MLALSRTKSPLFLPSLFHEKAIVHVGGEPFGSRYALQHDVASQPDVVLSSTTSTTEALLQQTRTIPIVFAVVADPVGSGFVASLPRPGGNVTGFSSVEGTIASKWLELLTGIAPGVKRAMMLFNPDTAPFIKSYVLPSFEAAARSLKVALIAAPVHN